jgi:hypothetical protein
MDKPYRFSAFNNLTKEQRDFNHIWEKPYGRYCEPYDWTIWEDTRYDAKLRLYNYLNGIKPKLYKPFEGTEIGKTIPILNF